MVDTISRLQVLNFTDDTLMTIDVARSIIERGEVDSDDLVRRFLQSYDPARGYGPTTTRVLEEVRRGVSWREASARVAEGGSWGNGAAMRVVPVGLFYCSDPDGLVKATELCSSVTHAHRLAIEGARLQARAVAMAAVTDPSELDRLEFISALRRDATSDVYAGKLAKVEEFLREGATRGQIISELGNGSEAFNSVPTAIYLFLANAGDFQRTVVEAASLGGDADTIASMSGGIAGALLGSGGLTAGWLERLERRSELERLASDLFFLYVRRTLGGRCEMCFSEESVLACKLDEAGGNDISNFTLLCRSCRSEMEREKEELFARPRKHGKYRAVYRKAHKRA